MTAPNPRCPRCTGTGWVWLTADTGDRAVEASCPDCCGPSAQAVLDWREAHHWSPQLRACRHCGHPTHLRDDGARPAHKVCAATALTTAAASSSTGGAA